jgi:hypothetical protein
VAAERKPLNDYLFSNVKIKAPFRTTVTSPLNKSSEEEPHKRDRFDFPSQAKIKNLCAYFNNEQPKHRRAET